MGGGTAYSLAELRGMGDEELVRLHDEWVSSDGEVMVGPNYLLDELHRREESRRVTSIVHLTWAIAGMTLIIMAATLIQAAT